MEDALSEGKPGPLELALLLLRDMFENNDDDEEVFHGFYEDWITFHGRTLTRLVSETYSLLAQSQPQTPEQQIRSYGGNNTYKMIMMIWFIHSHTQAHTHARTHI